MHRPVRALLVTDQTTLADSIELAFARRSFLTRRAANREETWAALNHWQPHLAVIDVDGTQPELLDRLGAPGIGIDRPSIIAITHQRNVETRLAAFAQGVDDILTVPFEPEELSARGAAILRRTHPEAVTFVPALCVGELEIDLVDRRVRVQGQDSQLTWLEQRLLYLLAANAGRVRRATRSCMRSGVPTTSQRATWLTGISATFASGCTIAGASRASSPPCPARATASCSASSASPSRSPAATTSPGRSLPCSIDSPPCPSK
ncbi:MAG: response regulator transcription factor [Sphaerobacter sp.]|nr:response regulator transcription factor [Sphaerobacter sp.]